MKILQSNAEGCIISYFDYQFEGWFEFITVFIKLNLADNESFILKAKQDAAFRHWYPTIPKSNKSEFYIVTYQPNGAIQISPQGDTIRLSGREFNSINDVIKANKWN